MAGGRPSKPISIVKGHRTKSEINKREKEEKNLITGVRLKESEEVKNNEFAHKEFTRLRNLLKKISKDDDLNGHVINAHCMLVSECKSLELLRQKYTDNLYNFENRVREEEITFTDEMKLLAKLEKSILDVDKALMSKRKMLLDIAKENLLTIQSALRSVNKTLEKEKESPMAQFLKNRATGE